MRESLPVSMWAREDRPACKIEELGVRSLTNAELLSIIIGAGTDSYNQVEIAQRLLAEYDNSLARIANLSVVQLKQSLGIGEATAKRILAALDLGRRTYMNTGEERPELSTATMIYNHMYPYIGRLDVEEFWVLLLTQHFQLIKKVKISHGGITETNVDIRIIMKEAVLANAPCIAVCHNHPSGKVSPSKCDEELTRRIHKACKLMTLHLLDHVIIGEGVYYSFHEQGRI